MNATPHPDGERIDLTDQVHAICADLEADLGAAAYQLHAREDIGNDLIARACDGDDSQFLARRALVIDCDGTEHPSLRVDLMELAR